HRFSGALSPFKVEAGFLDPPSNVNYAMETNLRSPSPAESSRQPTYALRVSASAKSEDRSATIGISSLYSPQRFLGRYDGTGLGRNGGLEDGVCTAHRVERAVFYGKRAGRIRRGAGNRGGATECRAVRNHHRTSVGEPGYHRRVVAVEDQDGRAK